MGLEGISIWQLLIIFLIVTLLFGSKRLGSLGEDLGSAIKGFKKAMKDHEATPSDEDPVQRKIAEDLNQQEKSEHTKQQ